MTRREILKVGLIFAGVALTAYGGVVACASADDQEVYVPGRNASAWKSMNVPAGVPRGATLVLMAGGIGCLAAGLRIREP